MRGAVAQTHQRGQQPIDEDELVLRPGSYRPLPWPSGKPSLMQLVSQRPYLSDEFSDHRRRQRGDPVLQALQAEAKDPENEILRLVRQLTPDLLDLFGVGPITAVQILVSWSHLGRFRSEAAFASFAGVSPIPASSGLTNRHRINRSGDRQLNRALHTIT